jgi:hypothetical protein
MWHYEEEEAPEYEEGKTDYTNRQLELMADEMLRSDSRAEMCRVCKERGEETGKARTEQQFGEDGQPIADDLGGFLYLVFPEYVCENKHKWYKGEGVARGIGGDNPILFEEHIQSRRRREIYTNQGTPDPEIVSGIYNRIHKDGRKVNSEEQRRKNGASFYR